MANVRRKSETVDPEAERLWDNFSECVEKQQDDIDRLGMMRKTLDSSISDSVWPTQSKLPLAEAWATTESQLGPALEYMFPSARFINMLSLDEVDADVRDKVAWALHIQLLYRMRLKYTCARSVRDSLSVSVGYSIVEPITITPPASFEIVAGENRTRQMGQGEPVRGIRHRYISTGRIVPGLSGTDFNGEDATPISFFLDSYPEDAFRNLYNPDATDCEDILLKGDYEKIIEEARNQPFSTQTTLSDFVEQMGGRGSVNRRTSRKTVACSVPVLKCYEPLKGKHTWLFCGGSRGSKPIVIFSDTSYSASRVPLVKWDPWVDSDRWFPMSQPEADMHNIWAKNVWFNAIFDLMTYSLKRSLVYDSTEVSEKDARKLLQPRGIAGFPGDVTKTVRYLDAPGVGNDMIQFGEVIDAQRRKITGDRDFTERNYTRGGSMAFQDLLQSSTGRERLRHAMFQMGSLESIANQTLIYMQVFGSAMDLKFQRPARRDGRDVVEQFSVTEDDLRHAYSLMIDLESKARLGSMDTQMRLQLYDRKAQSPYFDQYEVARGLCFDDAEAQREVLPQEVVREKQAQEEAAKLQAQAAQAAQAAPEGPGATPAMAGAMLGGVAS